ncbi:MAG: hypothetical protein RSD62_06400, partial [Ruthenibacterium sp.]
QIYFPFFFLVFIGPFKVMLCALQRASANPSFPPNLPSAILIGLHKNRQGSVQKPRNNSVYVT